jgi:hypothetical protein
MIGRGSLLLAEALLKFCFTPNACEATRFRLGRSGGLADRNVVAQALNVAAIELIEPAAA